MDRKGSQDLIQALVELVSELTIIGGAVRGYYRKECSNLTRRIKILAPLFEELREAGTSLPPESITPFRATLSALLKAKELLRECRDGRDGSQLVLVMDRDQTSARFRQLTADMSRALDGLLLDSLDVSDEVHEQVELVRAQLKRANGRYKGQDDSLILAVNNAFVKEADNGEDQDVLQNLAEKLQLQTETSWRHELRALEGRRSVVGNRSEKENLDRMIKVLKKIHPIAEDKTSKVQKSASSSRGGDAPVPPDDLKCPISLELMNDPVIVATGQTYERSCIQQWLDTGHKTCPKTGQQLPHLVLTPNYVLRSLITSWCESNGLDVPTSVNKRSKDEEAVVESLLLKLASDQTEVRRAAAHELRSLAKLSPENRLCIAESGAIPILVSLLSTSDHKTQEHAVTALLNLSIHENNKRAIVLAAAIDPIVEVLKHGNMEARENSAAALFSLSAVDEHKVTIGESGAIPALVVLLKEGQSRGKKDAATALFQLSIYNGNKAKAVRTGIVPPLMDLLMDTSLGMVDEALAILAVLATHREGRVAIGRANIVPILVDLIRDGSPRNKENGASILLYLCTSDTVHATTARQLGAAVPITELLQSGTSRAKRKALELLQHVQDSVFSNVGKTR